MNKRQEKRIMSKIAEFNRRTMEIIYYGSIPKPKPGFVGGPMPGIGVLDEAVKFNGLSIRYGGKKN